MVYKKQFAEQMFATKNNYVCVAGPCVSFNILLHHALESRVILGARAEHCSGIHMQTTLHDKCATSGISQCSMQLRRCNQE